MGEPLTASPSIKHRELDLDVVRGVAILLAIGWHFNAPTGVPVVDVLLWPGRTVGWAGVDLFFVLSGFLVGRILLRERIRTGSFDRWRFIKRRAFKLWPVLYIYLLAEVVIGDNDWQTFLLQNIVHLQNYLGTSLAQLWSLAVEEHFYLAVAVLFPLFIRRAGTPRTLLRVMGGVLVTCLALRFAGAALGATDTNIQWQTHFRADALAAGVLLAVVSVHYNETFSRLLGYRWLWFAVTLLGFGFLAVIPRTGLLFNTLGYSVALVAAAAFMLMLHKAAWVSRASWALRPIGHLGIYSYGLYIWHAAAGGLAVLGLTKAVSIVPALAVFAEAPVFVVILKYASAIAVGIAMTMAVEWPFLRVRDRLFPSPTETIAPKYLRS